MIYNKEFKKLLFLLLFFEVTVLTTVTSGKKNIFFNESDNYSFSLSDKMTENYFTGAKFIIGDYVLKDQPELTFTDFYKIQGANAYLKIGSSASEFSPWSIENLGRITPDDFFNYVNDKISYLSSFEITIEGICLDFSYDYDFALGMDSLTDEQVSWIFGFLDLLKTSNNSYKISILLTPKENNKIKSSDFVKKLDLELIDNDMKIDYIIFYDNRSNNNYFNFSDSESYLPVYFNFINEINDEENMQKGSRYSISQMCIFTDYINNDEFYKYLHQIEKIKASSGIVNFGFFNSNSLFYGVSEEGMNFLKIVADY